MAAAHPSGLLHIASQPLIASVSIGLSKDNPRAQKCTMVKHADAFADPIKLLASVLWSWYVCRLETYGRLELQWLQRVACISVYCITWLLEPLLCTFSSWQVLKI